MQKKAKANLNDKDTMEIVKLIHKVKAIEKKLEEATDENEKKRLTKYYNNNVKKINKVIYTNAVIVNE